MNHQGYTMHEIIQELNRLKKFEEVINQIEEHGEIELQKYITIEGETEWRVRCDGSLYYYFSDSLMNAMKLVAKEE